jgi:hypothetical protein
MQLYLALAALLSLAAVFAAYLGLQGRTLLLLEPLRGDSLLLPFGVRAAQVAGLGLLLAALLWLRGRAEPAGAPDATGAPSRHYGPYPL